MNGEGAMDHSLFHLANKWLFVPVLFIEIFSIWLTFGFSTDSYWNCCNAPHHCLERRCTKLAEHKVLRHLAVEKKLKADRAPSVHCPISSDSRLGPTAERAT